jgi:hypothetical protein
MYKHVNLHSKIGVYVFPFVYYSHKFNSHLFMNCRQFREFGEYIFSVTLIGLIFDLRLGITGRALGVGGLHVVESLVHTLAGEGGCAGPQAGDGRCCLC